MGEHLYHCEAEVPFGCPRRTPVRDLGLEGRAGREPHGRHGGLLESGVGGAHVFLQTQRTPALEPVTGESTRTRTHTPQPASSAAVLDLGLQHRVGV